MALHTLLALFALFSYAAASLPVCGNTGRQCIQGQSTCNGQVCVCDAGYVWGDAPFACYTQGQVAAESRNDVSLTTFNNETRNFPYPCRYLLTHVKQELKGRKRAVIGECEVKVHAFNTRVRGKVVTHGADIAVRLNYNNGSVVERSVRKYGIAENDNNMFYVNGVHDYVPDGPFTPSVNVMYSDAPNKVFLRCKEDPPNNQLVFEFAACGIRITFVPYDQVLRRNQPQIPGLSVAVNCAHHPVWLSINEVLGLAPSFQGGHLIADIVLPGLTDSQSLINRAFTNQAVQNQPDAQPGCAAANAAVSACNDYTRPNAYNNCYFMLLEAKFIKCVSNNGLDHADLFARCVAAWCQYKPCDPIISDLQVCASIRDQLPELDEFLDGDRCP